MQILVITCTWQRRLFSLDITHWQKRWLPVEHRRITSREATSLNCPADQQLNRKSSAARNRRGYARTTLIRDPDQATKLPSHTLLYAILSLSYSRTYNGNHLPLPRANQTRKNLPIAINHGEPYIAGVCSKISQRFTRHAKNLGEPGLAEIESFFSNSRHPQISFETRYLQHIVVSKVEWDQVWLHLDF